MPSCHPQSDERDINRFTEACCHFLNWVCFISVDSSCRSWNTWGSPHLPISGAESICIFPGNAGWIRGACCFPLFSLNPWLDLLPHFPLLVLACYWSKLLKTLNTCIKPTTPFPWFSRQCFIVCPVVYAPLWLSEISSYLVMECVSKITNSLLEWSV